MTREQFELLLLRFFGLTEALRSDQSHQGLLAEIQQALRAWQLAIVRHGLFGTYASNTFTGYVAA